jgi:hypothetical protein
MVKVRRFLLKILPALWLILALVTPAGAMLAQVIPYDPTPVGDAAQDGGGKTWAIAGQGQSARLSIWGRNQWEAAPIPPEVVGATPEVLGHGPDGSVLCVWRSDTAGSNILTRHKGSQSSVLAHFKVPGLLPQIQLLSDDKGNIWITREGEIYRIFPEAEQQISYSIAREQRHSYGRDFQMHSPILATPDGEGKLWFWSAALAGGINIASLRGILIEDDGQFIHHPTLVGLPDEKYTVIEKTDAHRMWVGVLKDGLYEVDVRTLVGKRVPEPVPDAFRYVQRVFRAGDDWYVVAGELWKPVPESDGNGRSGTLWRMRDGRWTKIISGIDGRVDYAQNPFRPWFLADEGLYLGSFGSGPWVVASDGSAPELLDWRYGVQLADVQRLFRLNDRMVMIVAFGRGTLAANIEDLLIRPASVAKVQTLKPLRPLVQDAKGRIWGVLYPGVHTLSEWNGEKWLGHPLPVEIDPTRIAYLGMDSQARIWLMPDSDRSQPAAIFDPDRNHWELYSSYNGALQAQLGTVGFRLGNEEYMVPSFSPDGRICFRDLWEKVNYFDGKTWRKWGGEQIRGDENFVMDGPPFFDRAGLLAVNIESKTWHFSEDAGWVSTTYQKGIGDRPPMHAPAPVPAPVGCPFSTADSMVRQNNTSYWLTWHDQLYKAIPGLCLPEFEAAEYHPFMDGRRLLNDVERQGAGKPLTDRRGNTFLSTATLNGPEVYVLLFAKGAVPEAGLKLEKLSADAVRMRFSTTAPGKSWFIWRLDGGAWSPPGTDPGVVVEWLPNGRHRIEAVAIDRNLRIDPSPAAAEFDVRIDPARQIAAMIRTLDSSDESQRERAVAGLIRQPDLALPALVKAREKASDKARWWIDATIQRIEQSGREKWPWLVHGGTWGTHAD